MAYVKITNFAIKDSTNDVIRGTEHDDEYNAIEASFVAQPSATQTLTNKTIALGSNTVSGTTAQFNTALSDGDFATLAGTETLTNKALNGSLGATTPSTVAATTIIGTDLTTTGNTILGNASTDTLNVGNGDLVKDASGNLGIGVTPSAWSTGKAVEVGQGGSGIYSYAAANSYFTMNCNYNTGWKYTASNYASYYQQINGYHQWFTAPSGTAGNPITFTQAMTLDANGHLGINGTVGNTLYVKAVDSANVFAVTGSNPAYLQIYTGLGSLTTSSGESATNSALFIRKDSTSNRSISAAGTINASGADYAEYMTKTNNFTLAKGAVVGINSDGKLTNVFADAISFMVKSTDPSYVGGDAWGNEESLGLTNPKQPIRTEDDTDETFAIKEAQYNADKSIFDEALEVARQLVDRIAFAGQVPVNVLDAIAGQYIIPVNDNGAIKGEAVSSPTFEQYQIAVGKVIAIEADGRARIIVKVA